MYSLSCRSIFPQRLFTKLIRTIAQIEKPRIFVRLLIKIYCSLYGIVTSNTSSYQTLNDFFTRSIHRPIDTDAKSIVSPCDGQIIAYGKIEGDTLMQIKEKSYTINELLCNDELAQKFYNGSFINIHLRPFDYHRFHMPLSASISGYGYIRGKLFPVNKRARNCIPKLYTKNERLVTILSYSHGEVLYISIGALGVGSMKVVYENNIQKNIKTRYHYFESPRSLPKGAELGLFELGSSIVLVFEKDTIEFDSRLFQGSPIYYGERIGILSNPK